MADEFEIKITGIEDVCRKLTESPTDIVKGAFAKALTSAAVPIVRELTPRVPVDTGKLRESIVTDVAVDAQGKGGRVKMGFGRLGHVARLVETGHRAIGHKPTKKQLIVKSTGTPMVAPKPFMRQALEAASEAAIAAFEQSLVESVNREL